MLSKKIHKIDLAIDALSLHEYECRLCPRECGVNREKGETGYCSTGYQASVSHALLHFGEEPVLSGKSKAKHGSGTVFFTGCSLKCKFCQNYQLSWLNKGNSVSDEELATMFLDLQSKGALNLNLVTPSHVLLPVLKALKIAYSHGLNLPLVYNSSAYEKSTVIKHLVGIVDIYLPDLKYYYSPLAKNLSNTPDYFKHASQVVLEMSSQQPVLYIGKENTVEKGLILRHLVLPGQVEDSLKILKWTKQKLPTSIGLSLMSQYFPCFKTPAEFNRTLTRQEYCRVLDYSKKIGLDYLFFQPEPFYPEENLMPDFSNIKPFNFK